MRRVLIAYTTAYREGGALFRRAASDLAERKRSTGSTVSLVATESKADFVRAMQGAGQLTELHVVAHAGLYGPMFGTTDWPEQLSPYEWRELAECGVPAFREGGEAFFHTCRSAVWFAPFFARAFGVPTWGNRLYTAFSSRPDCYAVASPNGPVWLHGWPSKKSHGRLVAAAKRVVKVRPDPMVCSQPEEPLGEAAYDRVAALYDATFADIRVRAPEWKWLQGRVPGGADVLDIGTGNGALLRALAGQIGSGVGVDVSPALLQHARDRGGNNLRFERVVGPVLPMADNSVDVVTSMLSFRYLDWDPLMAEVVRVLRPGGRLLVVDMVAKVPTAGELPLLGLHWMRAQLGRRRAPAYHAALARLVADPGWKRMLRYNPIRAEHELRWYLSSRFPAGTFDVLDVARRSRVLGFDSGPIHGLAAGPMSFP